MSNRASADQARQCQARAGPEVSVVICTLNRSGLLREALQSLVEQTARAYEVVVVDNGSTDDTSGVADGFRELLNLRYVREERTGLSHARNRGYREARGAYVAYMDDDAKARSDWMEGICRAIVREAPDVLGGPVEAFVEGEKPAWFPVESQTWSLGREPRELRKGEYLRGESIVFRKSVLERVGGFRTDLGMAGTSLGYGEETELQGRMRRRIPEAKLLYCPDVVVHHLVRAEKMTLGWQLRRCRRQGIQAGAIYDAEAFSGCRCPRLHGLVLMVGHLAVALLRAAVSPVRSRRVYPHWRTYVLEAVCPHVYSVFAYACFVFGRRREG